MAFIIKQGDTSPSLVATLLSSSREPAALTGATVQFHMRGSRASATPITGEATIVDPTAGQVRYDWATGDTATAGDYIAEFEVTYLDGAIETFPNDGYMDVTIQEAIA